ncbi:ATG16-domain-containing protein [Gymnopilus junonius]|uniref:ATG16-domain-containing protein n=1 Tax=Gymnopilus junonius TaxID=109634 RepID=A0A9P5NYB6_GYMJU|nr:ATG16-domain-containing protein [Gymnopilus junonius]
MAEPSWQELLRLRLAERNNNESAFAPVIEQYRRLAQQTKLLKERNATLLRAVGSVKGSPGLSSAGEDNPVRAAYLSSLETQISSLRDELANLYKTQGQNAQRLLSMNETLREKEELSRIDSENLRKARDEIVSLRRKVDQHAELMSEKDRTVQVNFLSINCQAQANSHSPDQILHDEISTSLLELSQVEERNQILAKDNAKLLQRWLDAKQVEANRMNEANEFYENMRTRHENVLSWRENSEGVSSSAPVSPDPTRSGKETASPESQAETRKTGPMPQAVPGVNLTPNG